LVFVGFAKLDIAKKVDIAIGSLLFGSGLRLDQIVHKLAHSSPDI
jgi:hypothetical protein